MASLEQNNPVTEYPVQPYIINPDKINQTEIRYPTQPSVILDVCMTCRWLGDTQRTS